MKVQEIPIADIVGFTVRGDEEETRSLANSIAEAGLVHPIVVRRVEGGYRMVAGRRRVAAHRMLDLGSIEAIVRDYDAEAAEIAEIDENLERLDLTALERSEAIARRLELRQNGIQVDEGVTAKPARGKAVKETAELEKVTERTVRRQEKVAKKICRAARDVLRGSKWADDTPALEVVAGFSDDEQLSVAHHMVKHDVDPATARRVLIGKYEKRPGRREWPSHLDAVMGVHRTELLQRLTSVRRAQKRLRDLLVAAKDMPHMQQVHEALQEYDRHWSGFQGWVTGGIMPVGPCPYCKAKGCEHCLGDGWLSDRKISNTKRELQDGGSKTEVKRWRL